MGLKIFRYVFVIILFSNIAMAEDLPNGQNLVISLENKQSSCAVAIGMNSTGNNFYEYEGTAGVNCVICSSIVSLEEDKTYCVNILDIQKEGYESKSNILLYLSDYSVGYFINFGMICTDVNNITKFCFKNADTGNYRLCVRHNVESGQVSKGRGHIYMYEAKESDYWKIISLFLGILTGAAFIIGAKI